MFDSFVRRRCHCSFVHSFASFMTRSTWSLSLFVVVVIAGLVAVVVAVVIVPLAAAIIYCRCCCCCPFVSSLFLVFVLCFRFFFPAVFALCFSCRFLAAVNCGNQRKDWLCCCACVCFFVLAAYVRSKDVCDHHLASIVRQFATGHRPADAF